MALGLLLESELISGLETSIHLGGSAFLEGELLWHHIPVEFPAIPKLPPLQAQPWNLQKFPLSEFATWLPFVYLNGRSQSLLNHHHTDPIGSQNSHFPPLYQTLKCWHKNSIMHSTSLQTHISILVRCHSNELSLREGKGLGAERRVHLIHLALLGLRDV